MSLVIALILTMSVTLLSGCGNKAPAPSASAASSKEASAPAAEASAPAVEATAESTKEASSAPAAETTDASAVEETAVSAAEPSGDSDGIGAVKEAAFLEGVDWSQEPELHAVVAAEVVEGTLGYNSLKYGLDWAVEKSEGKFTYELSLNGALVGNADMVDGLYSGIIQIGNGKAFINASFAPELECLTYPGYYAGSWEDYPAFLEAATEVCNEIYADYGLHEIASDIPNSTIFLMNDVLVQKPEDLKGLIVRVSGGALASSVEAWGGSPTVIALGDVATALERRTIDGMITGTGIVNDFKLYEISKNATFTTFHEGYSNIMCTEEYWNNLTEAQQKLLEGFVKETVKYNYEETANWKPVM